MNGLPALASNLASYGRNGDSMLVHMTPGEVNGLQALALAHGGSLSINPDTGLVEANFLKRILPALAGAALTIGSGGAINPFTAGMIVGGVETARTGDIGQGFMAGLGAYGGAGLGSGTLAAGAPATPAAPVTPTGLEATVSTQPAASFAGGNLAGTTTTTAATAPTSSVGANFAQAGQGVENIFSSGQTGELARTNFIGAPAQAATPTTAATPATGVGGYSGLAKSTLAAASPAMIEEPAPPPAPEDPYANYTGPNRPTERAISYPDAERRRRGVTSEFTYFTPSNPIPYADGGAVSPQAQVMQNIANVQQMAGIPALGAPFMGTPPAAAPAAPRAGLVYNPIPTNRTEMVYNPVAYQSVAIPARETGYGFKPVEVAGIPDELKDVYAANKTFGGTNIFGAEIPNIPASYAYDPATQTIRPTQTFLDALEARRQQQIADAAAAAAAEEQARLNYGGGGGYGDGFGGPSDGGGAVGGGGESNGASGGSVGAEGATASGGMGPGDGPGGWATGGSVPTLEEGGFVLTKKAIDGLGKGNNKKGQKVAQAGLGAIPIKGKGTGTSDSIRTTIAGRQPALVSNGEAYVPARKVKENGGAKAFYALMRRAEKAA